MLNGIKITPAEIRAAIKDVFRGGMVEHSESYIKVAATVCADALEAWIDAGRPGLPEKTEKEE